MEYSGQAYSIDGVALSVNCEVVPCNRYLCDVFIWRDCVMGIITVQYKGILLAVFDLEAQWFEVACYEIIRSDVVEG